MNRCYTCGADISGWHAIDNGNPPKCEACQRMIRELREREERRRER